MKTDCYDHGARFYDPALGRWHVMDPLMESHFEYTPHHYTFNNPILYIDPLGLDTTVYFLDQAEKPDNVRFILLMYMLKVMVRLKEHIEEVLSQIAILGTIH